jgi:hypothetical protein
MNSPSMANTQLRQASNATLQAPTARTSGSQLDAMRHLTRERPRPLICRKYQPPLARAALGKPRAPRLPRNEAAILLHRNRYTVCGSYGPLPPLKVFTTSRQQQGSRRKVIIDQSQGALSLSLVAEGELSHAEEEEEEEP